MDAQTTTTTDTASDVPPSQTVCVISGSNAPCPSCFTYPLVDYSYYAPAGVSVTINGTCTP